MNDSSEGGGGMPSEYEPEEFCEQFDQEFGTGNEDNKQPQQQQQDTVQRGFLQERE